MKPMKLTDVGAKAAEQYIVDPEWIMQQKLDGVRMLALYSEDTGWTFTNDGVKPINFAAAKLKLEAVETQLTQTIQAAGLTGVTLDGELIISTGIYHVFDILYVEHAPNLADDSGLIDIDPSNEWQWRHAALHELIGPFVGGTVQLSVTAYSEAEKRALWNDINERGVEGAVSKYIHSTYEPAYRTKEWVKHKLVKTADLVVIEINNWTPAPNPTGSAVLGVPTAWFENELGETVVTAYEPVCNASLIGKDPKIAPGTVVEIEYLYRDDKGGLVQPRIKKIRHDKTQVECDMAQFPEYSREILGAAPTYLTLQVDPNRAGELA